MKKVSLSYTKLSAKQLSNLVSSLLRDWTAAKVTVDDPVLTKLKTKLQEVSENYRKGISEVKDKVGRDELKALDKMRDRHLTVLVESVHLARYVTDPEQVTAYKVLSSLLKEAKKMKRANFVEESEYITGLLTQFKETSYQGQVQTLKLAPAISQLTKSQEAFDAALQKNRNVLQTKEIYDVVALRKSLQATYQELNDYLYVMATYSDKVAYKRLYTVFSTNQNAFKALATPRKSASKGKSKTIQADDEAKGSEKELTAPSPKAS